MFKTFLEKISDNGYAMTCHYNPEMHELYICVTKVGDTAKFASGMLPTEYLSDDERMVAELRRLIAQLEESNDG